MIYSNKNEQDIAQHTTEESEQEQAISRYKRWLTEQAQRDRTQEMEETSEYVRLASKPVVVRKRKFSPFAPFNDDLSALRTFIKWQRVAAACLLLAIAVGLFLQDEVTLLVIAAFFAFVRIFYTLVLACLSAGTFAWRAEVKIDDEIVDALADADWPTYTILCPLYKEATIVEQLVEGLQKLDYPPEKLEVFILVEENDSETIDALAAIVLPAHIRVLFLPPGEPRTKPRSCNYGLLNATGEYLVIYDAEDIPEPSQLKKTILTFAQSPANVGCVQAKLNFYNSRQNLLTRWFTAEYSARYDLTLPALQQAKLTIPLGGASNHFRTATLRRLGAWDIYNVTEDCDLGIRLAHYQLKTVILDSTTYEEANSQLKNWIRQRSRWIKGFMQTYLVYMRSPWQYVARKQWRAFLSLQYILGSNICASVASAFLLLILGCALVLWLFLGHFPLLVTVLVCLGGLLVSDAFSIVLAFMGCIKRGQYDLLKWMIFYPLYSLLLSFSSSLALYQIITKPHYWEKTDHGLTARDTEKSARN